MRVSVPPPPNDGIYSHISERVYHSDTESLSSSGAKILTTLTPAEYWENLNTPPDPKPQYDVGTGCHKMVLGEGAQLVRVEARNWMTNAAKEAREKAYLLGKVPLLAAQIEMAQVMAGKVFAHPLAAKLLEAGSAELSGYWHDAETGVRLRFRPDFLPEVGTGRPLVVDYKTAQSANPKRFAKACFDFGYHQQAAWYLTGLRETTGIEDAAFLFICQMKTEPYLVSVIQLDGEAIDIGQRQNRRAIDLYARCRESGQWPGYDSLYTVGLPRWAIAQAENELA